MAALAFVLWLAADVSAEFWGRTIPLKDDQGNLLALASDDHIVVEARVVVPKGQSPVQVTASQFKLRINGAKFGIPADSPGMAAAAVKYPDWTRKPRVEVGAGPVIIGRPAPVPRFPDDPNARLPPSRTGQNEAKAPESIGDRMTVAAWPDGQVHSERSGLLYFPWRGKVAKIKTLELEWSDGASQKVVKLR